MKRLWKYIPPCLSDVQGFQAVISETDGMGIVDDPSRYKFVPTAANPQMGGRGGFGGGKPPWAEDRGGRPEGGGKPPWAEGRGGRPGMRGSMRVVCSDLRNEDIIIGTESKILSTFEQNAEALSPEFVLLCNAPSSSMISSDLEGAAWKINERSQIPAASVNLHGDKDYLYGVSLTLEAIGKLLLTKAESTDSRGVNILGCNTIDICEEELSQIKELLSGNGWNVISCWGAKGSTAEGLKKASAAKVNLVVNVSGLKIAGFMQTEFGIPYVVGAPFGKEQSKEVLRLLEEASQDGESKAVSFNETAEGTKILYVGEQLRGNAIRNYLESRGAGRVTVTSLYDMDKSCMRDGDKKLSSEDDLAAISEGAEIVIGDPDCSGAVKGDGRWIELPNSGMSIVHPVLPVPMVADSLDNWLAAL